MSEDQLVTNDHLEEVKATFFRSFKIWWSALWREGFILMILGFIALLAANLFENIFSQSFTAWMGNINTNGKGIFIIALIVLSTLPVSF